MNTCGAKGFRSRCSNKWLGSHRGFQCILYPACTELTGLWTLRFPGGPLRDCYSGEVTLGSRPKGAGVK